MIRATCTVAFLIAAVIVITAALADEATPDQIQLMEEFLKGSDAEMRGVAIQMIRSEAKGETATKKFASLLPDLPPATQADLIDALGERADTAASKAVGEMAKSDDEKVRAAALRAMGNLGTPAEVPLLAEKAGSGSERERPAARQALVRMRGDGVHGAIVEALKKAAPAVRVALLGILAARNAQETVGVVLQQAGDENTDVRHAALVALRALADDGRTAELAKLVKAAKDADEQQLAELALLSACNRGREKCVPALAEAMKDAKGPARVLLLAAVARAGGDEALKTVAGAVKDADPTVQAEAVRLLAVWPDAAAAEPLRDVLKSAQKPNWQILAIRGLTRLGAPRKGKAADLKLLAEAMKAAQRPEEKRLILGALGSAGSLEGAEQAAASLSDVSVADEAALAVVMNVEAVKDGDQAKAKSLLEKAKKAAKNDGVRQRIDEALK